MNATTTTNPRQVPPQIAHHLTNWNMQANIVRAIHTVLIVTATVCSVLVAAKLNSLDKSLIEWLAVASAASIGLLSAFDIGARANRFRKAWRKINAAVMRFQQDPAFTLEALIRTYEQCEDIIGDVKENPAAKK